MTDLNTTDSLDLYAKVEDLLENTDAIDSLYRYYYTTLEQLSFDTLLDIGCGSGDFLLALKKQFPDATLKGIDLSPVMVERANAKGVDATTVDLCEFDETFDVMTAVFDMMNYLPKEALKGFFDCVKSRLNEGGYFLFDINTLYGFENVAVGAHIVEDTKRFLAIDSDFEETHYCADFTLFEKEQNGGYRKSTQRIHQFYHTVESLLEASGMELVVNQGLSLYELEEADKRFVILKR